jgi:putative hydrolase of the HAD superfamily
VTAADVGYRKPHPLLFESALERLGVAPHQAVFVGDSYEDDIVPAAQLGMTAVLKLNGREPDPRWVLARYQVPSLAALLQLAAFTRLRATQTWRSPARRPPRD